MSESLATRVKRWIKQAMRGMGGAVVSEKSKTVPPNIGEQPYKDNPKKTICYCNGGDRSQENKIRESEVCKNLGIDLYIFSPYIWSIFSSNVIIDNSFSDRLSVFISHKF